VDCDVRFQFAFLDSAWLVAEGSPMHFDLAEQPKKVDAIVGDEREFIFDYALGQFPVWLAAQAEMIYVGCLKTRAMSDHNQ
jgi:hypothetical protein